MSVAVEAESARVGVRAAKSNELAPLPRLAYCAVAWMLLFLSTPGLFRPLGFGHIAFVALVPWALAASRPGRHAKKIEWLAAAAGLAAISHWLWPVLWFVIPMIGIVTGLYVVVAGVVLRALARRFPLAFATPLAWLAGELPRFLLPTPLSFGWWRLGTMAHHTSWLLGSARVWGVWGLSFVFAAFGGMLADLWRRRSEAEPRASVAPVLGFGLVPLTLAMTLCVVTKPPELTDGPSVLLVQPGIEQTRKSFSSDPLRELFGDAAALTREGLDALVAKGDPPPDLVAWGETMLVASVVEDGLVEAVERGIQFLPWTGDTMSRSSALSLAALEEGLVQGLVFGKSRSRELLSPELLRRLESPWLDRVLAGEPLLPEGTSFFSGAVYVFVHENALRRQNAGFLWTANGPRQGPAAKVHLVPGAEDLQGTQDLPFLLSIMEQLGGYVPDFVPAERAGVLELETRAGERYRFGVSICYDNAFDDPFTRPAADSDVDFHLVASNEAWYLDGVEMDHMIAFSKTLAVATGRSVVRATNSGISAVIDPPGREVAALAVDGERKMVRGALPARVPVPVRTEAVRPGATLFARSEPWQPFVWGGLVLLGILLSGLPPVTRAARGASAPNVGTRPPGRA